ncbi:SAM-dependent methyltransferase [Sporolactobacillus terrae]|nr:SAM-dependent methyltransferase [Sporolactobacillus terrae]UAK15813.1 hypothetical protein K7399_12460 [Sporolactobacillus terrae]
MIAHPYNMNSIDTLPVVNILGTGVRGAKQLTLEVIDVIRKSSKVLFFPFEKINKNWLENFLNVPDPENLGDLYKEGARDQDNYRRITERIVEKARNFGDTAVLVPGHPQVGVSWIKNLQKLEEKGEIYLNKFDGISSFDTMINDLSRDPLDYGAVILDANRALLYQLHLDPRMDYYVYHICSVGNERTEYSNLSLHNHLNLFKNFLLKTFPPDHKVKLIRSINKNGKQAIVTNCPISDLEKLSDFITVDSSLFIPGTPVEIINNKFLNVLEKSEG